MHFPSYDSEIRGILPHYDSFHQETINLVLSALPEPAAWLDTGCGTGTLVERALKQFPTTRFVLADPSVEMLEVAMRKLSESDRVTFLNPACTQELSPEGIGTECFDVITAIQSHHYLSKEERTRATRACCDLLNEGGIFVTFENVRPLTDRGTEIGKLRWKRHQLDSGREPQTVEGHLERFGRVFFPLTAEEHLSILREAGFSVVELLWYSCMQAGFYCIK
ncbi:MAG TPA: class I SAM-dependent methyltransferase [Methanothrix sp.]|nr:class I SAM-dependent methyltransferase [Methanothrix sp.]